MAAITSKPARPEYAGQIFNLTGPAAFAGDDLALRARFRLRSRKYCLLQHKDLKPLKLPVLIMSSTGCHTRVLKKCHSAAVGRVIAKRVGPASTVPDAAHTRRLIQQACPNHTDVRSRREKRKSHDEHAASIT